MKYSGIGLLLLCLTSFPLQARAIAGVDIPEQLTIGLDTAMLRLRGAGVRTRFVIKVYTSVPADEGLMQAMPGEG
jgi:hypothetical protein